MKIIVLGCKGQLGRCLKDQLLGIGESPTFCSRQELDISDFEKTKHFICNLAPDVIINASAYTAVDGAEEDLVSADTVNHLAVKNIAEICAELDCWLFHISTDYVFDGLMCSPYSEIDQPNPQGVYGSTKLKGEYAIQNSDCKHIILRTSWVFSEYGNNFFKTMLRLGSEREQLNIVNDQIGCPTYAQDIAAVIVSIIPQLSSLTKINLYHYCGDQSCSWYDFALEIFERAKSLNFKVPSSINPIETSFYPTLAKRPTYSVLDCSAIESKFGVKMSNWRIGIDKSFSKINHWRLN